jgi:hypothetical protein
MEENGEDAVTLKMGIFENIFEFNMVAWETMRRTRPDAEQDIEDGRGILQKMEMDFWYFPWSENPCFAFHPPFFKG